jgi:pimeloyl-ACP methyl ester carboxylesterase
MDENTSDMLVSNEINRAGKFFSTLFIRLMFKSVHGWKNRIPDRALPFTHIGRDGSCLEAAIGLTPHAHVKGVVLLCHPFLKYGMHYFFNNELDKALNDQGFHVVTFNFKGFGHSNIKGHAFYEDVLSISDLIKRQFPHLPLHLLGCSFGGFQLSHALARDGSLFNSVVLDSVPCSVTTYFKNGLLGPAMKMLSNSKIAQATGTMAVKHALSKVSKLPIAFLYGSQDKYAPQQDIDELKAQCKDIVFMKFDGSDHLENYKKHKQAYIQFVVQFFTENTRPSLNGPLSPSID